MGFLVQYSLALIISYFHYVNGLSMNSLYSSISRVHKKILFVTLDLIVLPIALWSSFALRFSDFWPYDRMAPFWWMFIAVPFVGVYLFSRLGLYRAVVRFMGQQTTISILKGVILLSLTLYTLAHLSAVPEFPRSIPINLAIIAGLYVSASRFLVRAYYHSYGAAELGKDNVIIYGAGDSGCHLSISLANVSEFNAVAFVDDDPALQGHTINSLTVYAPTDIDKLIEEQAVKRILLAMPSISKLNTKEILQRLNSLPVHIQKLPSLSDIVTGQAIYEQLQEVELDDLLGREVVPPDEVLLTKTISDKTVLVTGAGGSIGSELCRQIIKLKPKLLIMYENSEFALYSIEKELIESVSDEYETCYELIPILGSVLNTNRVDNVMKQYGVQTIFHAAAYKHVPMVEHNILEGVRNNILGTKVVAESALKHGAERFILISTDKAVRPTNVMGATKRSAEQVIQLLAERSGTTVFSMVRFGNVLGSSGSVVPLFRRQIEEGGPLTVTHREITRYFMSISEASQLVIQAGTMALGGDVFVLNMGEPVKIYDLAKNMIQLSGYEVQDEFNPYGDIAIKITGLRPGEKLYEELLIGDNIQGTGHSLIMRANEEFLSENQLNSALASLEKCIGDNNASAARDVLMGIVTDYQPSSRVVDHLHQPLNINKDSISGSREPKIISFNKVDEIESL